MVRAPSSVTLTHSYRQAHRHAPGMLPWHALETPQAKAAGPKAVTRLHACALHRPKRVDTHVHTHVGEQPCQDAPQTVACSPLSCGPRNKPLECDSHTLQRARYAVNGAVDYRLPIRKRPTERTH